MREGRLFHSTGGAGSHSDGLSLDAVLSVVSHRPAPCFAVRVASPNRNGWRSVCASLVLVPETRADRLGSFRTKPRVFTVSVYQAPSPGCLGWGGPPPPPGGGGGGFFWGGGGGGGGGSRLTTKTTIGNVPT